MIWESYNNNNNNNDDPSKHSHKSIAGRYQPVRVADGPITARCRFIKKKMLAGTTVIIIVIRYIPKYSKSSLFI